MLPGSPLPLDGEDVARGRIVAGVQEGEVWFWPGIEQGQGAACLFDGLRLATGS